MGREGNVWPASFRINSLANKHAMKKHNLQRKICLCLSPFMLKPLILDLLLFPGSKEKTPQNKPKASATGKKKPYLLKNLKMEVQSRSTLTN